MIVLRPKTQDYFSALPHKITVFGENNFQIRKQKRNTEVRTYMNTIVGKQSICFQRPPQIVSAASVVGKKESEGPLGALFDEAEPDPMAGQATWEEAESALQKQGGAAGNAESGGAAGTGRAAGAVSFFRGSVGTAHCHLFRRDGSEATFVRSVRGLLDHRGGADAGSHDRTGRLF